jgi:Mrp family chromosome partitioning ATPase
VLSTQGDSPAERRVAAELLNNLAKPWPSGWQRDADDRLGGRVALPIDEKFLAVDRLHSKQAWLAAEPAKPPWPLRTQTPAIVSFYSFKGGVGRSTALGVVAWQLAREGKKVVCVDLDLEAPGLARLLGIEGYDSGVLDVLLTHLVTGESSVKDVVRDIDLHGAKFQVLPAGRLDLGYLEKLGRLDFLRIGEAEESPVEEDFARQSGRPPRPGWAGDQRPASRRRACGPR